LWTALLDAVRLGPGDDQTAVTALQVREVIDRLAGGRAVKARRPGHPGSSWTPGTTSPGWRSGWRSCWPTCRSSYWAGCARIGSCGYLRLPAATRGYPRRRGVPAPTVGLPSTAASSASRTRPPGRTHDTPRPPRRPAMAPRSPAPGTGCTHGSPTAPPGSTVRVNCPSSRGRSSACRSTICRAERPQTGLAVVVAHQRLGRRHRPALAGVLRRFDLEHTFRLFKQTLGLPSAGPHPRSATPRPPTGGPGCSSPRIPSSASPAPSPTTCADHGNHPHRPAPPGRLTPARVRRGFRNIRAKTTCPAGAPKPGKPGPGRPPRSTNRRPTPHHHVGKTIKRETTLAARFGQAAQTTR
jgi:hypothetical protein